MNTLAQLDKEIRKIENEEEKLAAIERLKAIARVYEGEDEILLWPSLLDEFSVEREVISSGYPSLDALLRGGFRPQQLIAISALTKSGKTSFVVDLTSKMLHYTPLWLPFEEGVEELSEKFKDRNEAIPNFASPKFMKAYDLKWVEDKLVEGIAKHNSRVMVIDHLDFIVPFNTDRHDLRVSEAMRFLKGLAKKWNVVIFLICHLTKAKMDVQPTLEDLRGSASIGQESDTVILLWREMKREEGQVVITSNVNVSVQAARRGRPGNVKMVFKDDRFHEEDWGLSDVDKEFHRTW